MVVSPPCMSEADRYSLEALRSIHQMMDDDQDGGIEVEESLEFIIEDMKQQQTNKHSNLHREDQHITVEELWRGWKSSEVHNWTQDEVLRWLKEFVELPQYERNFKDFKVNGNTLPRIAANEPSFLSIHLRVQDQRDKQKLNIKALDVVLFGPPTRPPHNYMKDLLLIVSVVMGVGGCWFAQAQNKASKVHIAKMMKDLESLQRAEQSLIDLQEQLERAQEEKRNVAEEKQNLEEKMRDEIMGAQEEAHRLHELRQGAVTELSRLRYAEEELEQVRGALKQAEKDMQASWTASDALQLWLQLTHEVEVQYYNVKKHSAELQLATAKDEAERIKKKRSSVLGTLHVAHSSSLDQVDQKILEAKNALCEVTACLRERLHRWQQIERICSFPIIRNPGLAKLTAQLYTESIALGLPRGPQPSCSCHSSLHGSIEDLLEESASPILPQMQEFPSRKVERDMIGDLIDTTSRNIYRERSDLPLDARKILWNELEASADQQAPRKISRGMMGASVDSASRKIVQDDAEHLFDSVFRRVTRDSLGMSLDTGSRKLPWNKEECQLDSSVRALAMDKMVETTRKPPRRISREELEYSTDTASLKILPREKFDAPTDTLSSTEKQEFCLEPSPNRKILRDEHEMSAGSLRRRIPRMPSVDVSMEIHKQSTLREEMGASESSSSPGRIGQPDLMVTSQAPWKSSSDLFTVGPLSQLVYDGILEKSCNSTPTTPTSLSASVPNLRQNRLQAEMEKPLPPPRVTPTSPVSPIETGDERTKDKEKSKKSLKLKNLFKKKNESAAAKHQSGLQKL
uniref:Stromal interaction molecule 2 n=1 Tax=Seriola dumerili TaxID=41447 RepID=A0A3B4TES4_SERDU